MWQKLESHLNARIDLMRCQNDGDLNEIATARLRGRIKELKDLLDAANPPPAISDTDA